MRVCALVPIRGRERTFLFTPQYLQHHLGPHAEAPGKAGFHIGRAVSMADFSDRIKELRIEKGLTQERVGSIINVKNMLSTPMKRAGPVQI